LQSKTTFARMHDERFIAGLSRRHKVRFRRDKGKNPKKPSVPQVKLEWRSRRSRLIRLIFRRRSQSVKVLQGADIICGEAGWHGRLLRELGANITGVADDPGKMREVVYEAARLALRWQVQDQRPNLSIIQAQRQISELEEAIARLEADTLGPPGMVEEPFLEPQQPPSAELVGLEAVARSLGGRGNTEPGKAANQSEDDDARERVEGSGRQPLDPRRQAVTRSVEGCRLHAAAVRSEESRQVRKENNAPEARQKPSPQPWNQPETEPSKLAPVLASGQSDKSGPKRAAKIIETSRRALVEVEENDNLRQPLEPSQAEPAEAEGNRAQPLGQAQPAISYDNEARQSRHKEIPDQPSSQPQQPADARRQDGQTQIEFGDDDPLEPLPCLTQVEPADGSRKGYREESGGAGASLEASRRSPYGPVEPDNNSLEIVEEQVALMSSQQQLLVPDPVRRQTYLVNPADFVSPEVTYRISPAPQSRTRVAVFGLIIASQLAIATLSGAAFYVAMEVRNSPVQTAKETLPAAEHPSSDYLAASPYGMLADAAATPAAPPAASAMPYPRPTAYGVYGINGRQLIELEQVQGTPVDPRVRNQLQINTPARAVIGAAKPTFVVFRRDLISSAPDKVPVRIASRIAHSMIFDAAGKPVVTTPATDTWLIRDRGFDFHRCGKVPRW
jgi:hypothetical protein